MDIHDYFICSFKKYILNADYEPSIALYTGDTDVNKADINHHF